MSGFGVGGGGVAGRTITTAENWDGDDFVLVGIVAGLAFTECEHFMQGCVV